MAKTTACATCGVPLNRTPQLAGATCDRCWEVETRLAGYLKSPIARATVATLLAQATQPAQPVSLAAEIEAVLTVHGEGFLNLDLEGPDPQAVKAALQDILAVLQRRLGYVELG